MIGETLVHLRVNDKSSKKKVQKRVQISVSELADSCLLISVLASEKERKKKTIDATLFQITLDPVTGYDVTNSKMSKINDEGMVRVFQDCCDLQTTKIS